jgi:hypothetical protein
MNSKSIMILGGVLVVAGIAAFVMKGGNTPFTPKAAEVGQPALKDFKAADIGSISINDGKKSVDLALKDGKWVVASRDDFPATLTSVNEVGDTAFDLKVQQVETGVTKEELPELGLAEAGGTAKDDAVGKTLVIKDASGKEMASLLVGKTQSPPMTGNIFEANGPRPAPQWIKVKGVDAVYRTVTGFSKLDGDPKLWLDKEKFFKVEKHKSMAVTGPTPEESWKIYRETDGGELKLDAPKPGEEFDATKAASQGSMFGYISFEDILPAAEKDKAALDKPTHTAVIQTFDGLTYTVKVGAKVPPPPAGADATSTPTDSYYVSFTVEGKLDETVPAYSTPQPVAPTAPAADAKEEDKKKYEEAKKSHETALKAWEEGKKTAETTFQDQLKTKKEKLVAEQALQSRIFVVAKSSLDPVMKKRSEFMKDKPVAPAPGASTPGTATPSPGAISPVPGSIKPSLSAPRPAPGTSVPAPAPGKTGKIEAVTPPIEVTIPGKEAPKDAPKAAPPLPPEAPKDGAKKPEDKKDPKKPK